MERNTVGPDGPRPPQHSATNGGHEGHADHAAEFRERFWWSLALSGPVVAFSGMFADAAVRERLRQR